MGVKLGRLYGHRNLGLVYLRIGYLGRIFGSKKDEGTGNGENYIMRRIMICILHQILVGGSNRK